MSARIKIERAIHVDSDRPGVALCGHRPPASQFVEADGAMQHDEVRGCEKCAAVAVGKPKRPASREDVIGPFNRKAATAGWLA